MAPPRPVSDPRNGRGAGKSKDCTISDVTCPEQPSPPAWCPGERPPGGHPATRHATRPQRCGSWRLLPGLRSLRRLAGAALLLAPAAWAAPEAPPVLSLDELAKPSAVIARSTVVVPAQVLRWRQEAAALEHGENGMPRDLPAAAALYCKAARHGDAESQYSLAWMLTNDRGIARDDAAAAHLFAAAAEQGHEQAANMARVLGTPRGRVPACLLPPTEEEAQAVAAADAPTATRQPRNAPPAIVHFVRLVAPEYQLDPNLVLAVMATESNFNPWAVSPKDARGLMQLIPDTARRFQVKDLMDPTQNIRGGMAYLRWLLAYFEGDASLALAAYNAGEGAVERYRGVPPYAETRLYVYKILAALGGRRSYRFDARVTAPSQVLSQAKQGKLSSR